MIRGAIPSGSSSLLDIGSNLGDFTALSAASGLWSVGIERTEALVHESRRRHRNVQNCHFICSELDPPTAKKLPRFDVLLLLSVYHRWHAGYGPERAVQMLKDLTAATGRLVIFEGPSRTSRYKTDKPDFTSNDETSVTEYYSAFLKTHLGPMSSAIRLLGKAPCVGEREPYRWTFAVVK